MTSSMEVLLYLSSVRVRQVEQGANGGGEERTGRIENSSRLSRSRSTYDIFSSWSGFEHPVNGIH
jgi:hypothetical protein